jgi:LacI family transcriptional regulator
MTAARFTSHDVAREAGVSQATVSRALRGDARISAATIERVQQAAGRLGYVPSKAGRNLSRRSTGQIAVVVELEGFTRPDMLSGLHDQLSRQGYGMLLVSGVAAEADGSVLLDGSVDGAVLTTTRLASSLPERLRSAGVPFILLDRVTRGVDADSVAADNSRGARAAAQLLLGEGHRSIALLGGPGDLSTAAVRERTFVSVLREAGIEAASRPVIRGELDHEAGRHGWARLQSLATRPTAVLCSADAVAVGLLNAIAEQGDAGRRPAVVGFGDTPVASWPVFSLTTVDIHLGEMARIAGRMLVERLESLSRGESLPARKVVVPTSLVLRRSHIPA